jgi:O-Antigen ligase
LVGEVHGVTSGGDMTTSLWEVRAQVYMFVAYVLACNLVKTRRQVDVLVWILVLGSGLKGVQGLWRWLITLHGDLHTVQEIFPHEQSFFFNGFLILTPILFLYGGSRRLKRTALGLLPFVILASLANQRRAAIIALLVAMLGLAFVTLVAHPPRRRVAVKILLVLAVILPPYVIIFGHSNSLVASPARAIMSGFHPDARDAGSNWYRNNEDKDIMYTMKTSPLIGYGFGKPMIKAYPLADISNIYVWWLILPHDSILWVWMRLGTIGYVLLWLLIGTALVQTAQLVRRFGDPTLKGLALWLILLVMQEIVFGYLDLQWTNYRNLITVGVLFALVGRLATFARTEENAPERAHAVPGLRRGTTVTPSLSHSLAVVNGRLAKQPARIGSAPGRLRVGRPHD